jgi:hypothetical protein
MKRDLLGVVSKRLSRKISVIRKKKIVRKNRRKKKLIDCNASITTNYRQSLLQLSIPRSLYLSSPIKTTKIPFFICVLGKGHNSDENRLQKLKISPRFVIRQMCVHCIYKQICLLNNQKILFCVFREK